MYQRKYKCPFCDKRETREKLISHISKYHKELIPENQTAAQVVFNTINHKDHGTCVVCGKETEWNEDTYRYKRYCSKKCKDILAQRAKANMMKIYGKTTLLNDPMQQEKMLANRSISGKYKFGDKTFTFTGSYERKLLEFMDKVLHLDPNDIVMPGPVIEYSNNGTKRFWITDCYYEPYNLVIEIKDGGDNPNKREMIDYRKKQIDKEAALMKLGKYNYIRLTNNDMPQLLEVFIDIKLSMQDEDYQNGKYKIIKVNESSIVLSEGADESTNNKEFLDVQQLYISTKYRVEAHPKYIKKMEGYKDDPEELQRMKEFVDSRIKIVVNNFKPKKELSMEEAAIACTVVVLFFITEVEYVKMMDFLDDHYGGADVLFNPYLVNRIERSKF